jgi:hypothetical protein
MLYHHANFFFDESRQNICHFSLLFEKSYKAEIGSVQKVKTTSQYLQPQKIKSQIRTTQHVKMVKS